MVKKGGVFVIYNERPTELFWRIFYVYGAVVLIGLSLALAAAPLILIYYYPVPLAYSIVSLSRHRWVWGVLVYEHIPSFILERTESL